RRTVQTPFSFFLNNSALLSLSSPGHTLCPRRAREGGLDDGGIVTNSPVRLENLPYATDAKDICGRRSGDYNTGIRARPVCAGDNHYADSKTSGRRSTGGARPGKPEGKVPDRRGGQLGRGPGGFLPGPRLES